MNDFPPYRPPSEANSALIRVTRGCAWNRCAFCGMYKKVRFEPRSFEEVETDIDRLPDYFPSCDTVFMGDSDSLVHPDILRIVQLIRRRFIDLKRLTSYTRASTLARMDAADLKSLCEAGLNRIHVGLESGDAAVLEAIKKGATPEIMIEGGTKAVAAGFELCFYVLCGAGGEALWRRHADGSAGVINKVNPHFVRLRTLTLVPGTSLRIAADKGKFEPIHPVTRLRETRRLIEKLTDFEGMLASDHVTNYLWAPEGLVYRGVDGRLPADRGAMVKILSDAIDRFDGRDDVADADTLVKRGLIANL